MIHPIRRLSHNKRNAPDTVPAPYLNFCLFERVIQQVFTGKTIYRPENCSIRFLAFSSLMNGLTSPGLTMENRFPLGTRTM